MRFFVVAPPKALLPPTQLPGRKPSTVADMASSSLQQMAPGLVTRSKMLINNDLKKICRDEGLASSGVKAVLQGRVIDCTVTQFPSHATCWLACPLD